MKFIQDRPEECYHTDDAARIYFRGFVARPPESLRCVGMGYALFAHSNVQYDVELAAFELIGVGSFGDSRPCDGLTGTKWTGDSYKYGIYKYRRSLLIIESHGGGEQGYFDQHSHAVELFDQVCPTLPRERIWDLCHLVARTQNQAYLKGRDEMARLFLQNRKSTKRDSDR